MKSIRIALALIAGTSAMFFSKPTLAEGEVALGALAGALGGSYVAYNNALVNELTDWADANTKSTANLSHGCGVKLETRLVGNNLYNYLFLVLKNDGSSPILFPYDEVRFDFDTGISRLPSLVQNFSPLTLEPGHQWIGFLAFPSKDDFKDAKYLSVTFPIADPETKEPCKIVVSFNHNKEVQPKETTYTSYSSMELRFGLGGAVTRSGPQKGLATDGVELDLTLKAYPSIHWGGMLGFHFDYMGDGNAAALAPATGSPTVTPKLSVIHFFLGPSYRTFLGEKWTLSLEAAPALAVASYNQVLSNKQDDSALFSLYGRANIGYLIKRQRDGFFRGDYGVGLSVYDAWMPNASDLAGIGFGGNNFGLMGYLSIGL